MGRSAEDNVQAGEAIGEWAKQRLVFCGESQDRQPDDGITQATVDVQRDDGFLKGGAGVGGGGGHVRVGGGVGGRKDSEFRSGNPNVNGSRTIRGSLGTR